MAKPRIHREPVAEARDLTTATRPRSPVDAPSKPAAADLTDVKAADALRGTAPDLAVGRSEAPAPPPPPDGAAPEAPAPSIPDGARVWENRSDEPGSPYTDMQGPDIVYADEVWYAVGPDGSLRPIAEGRELDLHEADTSQLEAFQFEVLAGTPLFGQVWPSDLGLRVDGETGDLVTDDGVPFDPDALALVRASDGTTLWYDTDSGSYWPFHELGVPIDALPAEVPLTLDPESLTYHRPDGHVVGFHESLHEGMRTWENRSGEPDAPYTDMRGPDISYVDGVWYQQAEDGSYRPIHEGTQLSFAEGDTSILEALQYEVLAGTPMENRPLLGELGFRLDGETGLLVDADGQPVDLAAFDPSAPNHGFPLTEEPDGSDGPAPDGSEAAAEDEGGREEGNEEGEAGGDDDAGAAGGDTVGGVTALRPSLDLAVDPARLDRSEPPPDDGRDAAVRRPVPDTRDDRDLDGFGSGATRATAGLGDLAGERPPLDPDLAPSTAELDLAASGRGVPPDPDGAGAADEVARAFEEPFEDAATDDPVADDLVADDLVIDDPVVDDDPAIEP